MVNEVCAGQKFRCEAVGKKAPESRSNGHGSVENAEKIEQVEKHEKVEGGRTREGPRIKLMIGSTKAGVHSSVPGTDRRSWMRVKKVGRKPGVGRSSKTFA